MLTQADATQWLESLSVEEQDSLYQNFCFEVLSATDTHDRGATSQKREKLSALGRAFGFTNDHKSALMNQAAKQRKEILIYLETVVPA